MLINLVEFCRASLVVYRIVLYNILLKYLFKSYNSVIGTSLFFMKQINVYTRITYWTLSSDHWC